MYEEACQILGPDLAARLRGVVESMLSTNRGASQQEKIEAIETLLVGQLATVIHASRAQYDPIIEAQDCSEFLMALVTQMVAIEPEQSAPDSGFEEFDKLNVIKLRRTGNQ
ncbi:MAG: hypothetical protein AAFV69_01285 [Pseudomonadota bacterium]